MEQGQQGKHNKKAFSVGDPEKSCTDVEEVFVVAWKIYWPAFRENLPVKSIKNKPRKSINSLLLFLGAPYCDVYKKPSSHHVKRTTIYDRYSIGELETMLENLYRKFKSENHPDRFSNPIVKEGQEEIFKTGSETYCRAKRILRKRPA